MNRYKKKNKKRSLISNFDRFLIFFSDFSQIYKRKYILQYIFNFVTML
jgi:hypothetical protein